jgi:hypothetical protein
MCWTWTEFRLYALCSVKIHSVATLFLVLIQHRYPLTKPTLNPRVIKIHLFCSVNNSLGTVYFSSQWICTDVYNCKIWIFWIISWLTFCTWYLLVQYMYFPRNIFSNKDIEKFCVWYLCMQIQCWKKWVWKVDRETFPRVKVKKISVLGKHIRQTRKRTSM